MSMGEPRRRRSGRGGEIGKDAVLREQVEQTIEPAELVATRLRLEQSPREHAYGGRVDAGVAH
jgi:hypothetical protein